MSQRKKKPQGKSKPPERGTGQVHITPTDATVAFVPVPPRSARATRGIHARKVAPPVEPGEPSEDASTTPPIELTDES